jgi:pyruvate dehydrogenase E2 component (dihydrolipoamide acetyltransferase)
VSKENIKVPDIGGIENVEVIEVCVSVGDQVVAEDSLVVLESDKASMEIPSPVSGTITSINVVEGDLLSEGDSILEILIDSKGVAAEVKADLPEKEASPLADSRSIDTQQDKGRAVNVDDLASAGSTIVEKIFIPDIGEADNVEVIEVCANIGDDISEGDSLIVLETDKASMEIPSPRSGKVVAIFVKESDVVVQGMPILDLEYSSNEQKKGGAVEEKLAAHPNTSNLELQNKAIESKEVPSTLPVSADAKPITEEAFPSLQSGKMVYAGPSVRRLARDMGVELKGVTGSGPRSRITKNDIKSFVKVALAALPQKGPEMGIPTIPNVDFSKFGEIRIEKLTKIAKLTATNMQRNWLNVPHVTQFDESDITDLEEFRKSLKDEAAKRGVKLTPLPFLLKACAMALREHPKLNSSLHGDGESLVYKEFVNLGMAVDTPAGLLVPVMLDVDKKTIWEIAAETAELAQKAKERKLMPKQMQGAGFTISSLGGIGGLGFTPIVNAPEVAILGVSKLQIKPQWTGSEFVPRKMLPLALSYDHRAINGVDGGKFITRVVEMLGDIRNLVL